MSEDFVKILMSLENNVSTSLKLTLPTSTFHDFFSHGACIVEIILETRSSSNYF